MIKNGNSVMLERNEATKKGLHREVDILLTMLADPSYKGSISVELSAKDGVLNEPKITVVRWGVDRK
jgi:hypothetical protein